MLTRVLLVLTCAVGASFGSGDYWWMNDPNAFASVNTVNTGSGNQAQGGNSGCCGGHQAVVKPAPPPQSASQGGCGPGGCRQQAAGGPASQGPSQQPPQRRKTGGGGGGGGGGGSYGGSQGSGVPQPSPPRPGAPLVQTECPSDMKCVADHFCDENAVMSNFRVSLTPRQKEQRGVLISCMLNQNTGTFGVCCQIPAPSGPPRTQTQSQPRPQAQPARPLPVVASPSNNNNQQISQPQPPRRQQQQQQQRPQSSAPAPAAGGGCPVVNDLPPVEECRGRGSNCWSVGEPDSDCPGLAFCCFDGCANTCQGPAPPPGQARPQNLPARPSRPSRPNAQRPSQGSSSQGGFNQQRPNQGSSSNQNPRRPAAGAGASRPSSSTTHTQTTQPQQSGYPSGGYPSGGSSSRPSASRPSAQRPTASSSNQDNIVYPSNSVHQSSGSNNYKPQQGSSSGSRPAARPASRPASRPAARPASRPASRPSSNNQQQQGSFPQGSGGTASSSNNNQLFPPKGRPQPPAETKPHVMCPSAMLCIQREFCDFKGFITDKPLNNLTPELEMLRVPLIPCVNPDNQNIDVCCRDPNYKDPWPQNGNGGNGGNGKRGNGGNNIGNNFARSGVQQQQGSHQGYQSGGGGGSGGCGGGC